MREQLIREVKEIGNGAHILAPREWVGDRVFVVRTPMKPVRARVFDALGDYLEHIEGVYLYGSHARGEAQKDSDIDLFVVTNKKMKIIVNGFEIITLEKSKIKDAMKFSPILMGSILSEAKPLINSMLLEELKGSCKISKNSFKKYLEETENIISINEELLEREGGGKIRAGEIAYSLILRLRGIYLIKVLLEGKRYASGKFRSWVGDDEIIDAYNKYKRRNLSVRLEKDKLLGALLFLKKEIKRIFE